MAEAQNESIRLAVEKERRRLLDFIRKRVPTQEDAEDILQDVFYELVETYRLVKPVQQIASWLFAVARNKITDRYRKKKPDSLEDHFKVACHSRAMMATGLIFPIFCLQTAIRLKPK